HLRHLSSRAQFGETRMLAFTHGGADLAPRVAAEHEDKRRNEDQQRLAEVLLVAADQGLGDAVVACFGRPELAAPRDLLLVALIGLRVELLRADVRPPPGTTDPAESENE